MNDRSAHELLDQVVLGDCGGQAYCWCGQPAKYMGLNPNTEHADAEYSCGGGGEKCPHLVDCYELDDGGAHEYCDCKRGTDQ